MIPIIYLHIALAFIAALVICLAATPLVNAFARRVGALDVPRDETRMHKIPIPRLGGLAIFLGFIFAIVLFADVSRQVQGVLLGAVFVVIIGAIDDIITLKWHIKFAVQIFAAMIAVYHGVVIQTLSNPNVFSAVEFISFGSVMAGVITVGWIVGITNAVNFIDGLDGLACGVSAISSVTMLIIALLVADLNIALITAALAGACIGFLPYNFADAGKPAKIFMGDSGAYLLGYILATVSILGLFKSFAIISFAAPFLVMGLPMFDTLFAIVRRVARGKHPMHRDRGHFHHRLIDMGLSQKQSVAILYAVSIVLGMSAVVITTSGEIRAIIFVLAVVLAAAIAVFIMRQRNAAQNGDGGGSDNDKDTE